MKDRTKDKFEEAVCCCLDKCIDNDLENTDESFKLAVQGYDKLIETAKIEEQKKSTKNKVLKWFADLGLVLIPAVAIELLSEAFLNRQANKAYIFEKEGTITTTPGKNFIGNIFRRNPKTRV